MQIEEQEKAEGEETAAAKKIKLEDEVSCNTLLTLCDTSFAMY